jgi:transcriptional regulator with XRE-family HTH domain
MSTPRRVMRQWLNKATAVQKRQVAEAAGTSVPHLQHIAGGRRTVSAELAQSLAAASKDLHIKALLIDARTLCAICAVCPLVDKRKAPIAAPEKPKAA